MCFQPLNQTKLRFKAIWVRILLPNSPNHSQKPKLIIFFTFTGGNIVVHVNEYQALSMQTKLKYISFKTAKQQDSAYVCFEQ